MNAALEGFLAEEAEAVQSNDVPGATLSVNHALSNMTQLEQRALVLLGDGHSQETVASTLGVTPGRITQLMSVDWFAEEVSKLRLERLQEHTTRDRKLDRLEDRIIEKLDRSLNLLHKPMDMLRAFRELNQAKRRGNPADTGAILINQTVVNLTLPEAAVNKYRANASGQVIEVNDRSFLTAPTSLLPEIAKNAIQPRELPPTEGNSTGLSNPINHKGQVICTEDL